MKTKKQAAYRIASTSVLNIDFIASKLKEQEDPVYQEKHRVSDICGIWYNPFQLQEQIDKFKFAWKVYLTCAD